jgi:vacuolar-type H+-ATPase subunit C/Vma6
MKDYNIDTIQLRVRKIWMQDFAKWCETELSETSSEVMTHLLKFESDCRTIQIIANSLHFNNMSDSHRREEKRGKYMASLGYLYPSRYDKLMHVVNAKDMKDALEGSEYSRLIHDANFEDRGQD